MREGESDVRDLEGVSEDRMRGYVLGKEEYERVFPKFYDVIAERLEAALKAEFPEFKFIVGPRDWENATSKFPELGGDVPLDWVAFGFGSLDLYEYHIGVVLEMSEWPVQYSIGLHVMDHVPESAREEADAIDWPEAIGREPIRVYSEPVREHRWLDPTRELDFGNLPGEVKWIVGRVIGYYGAAAGPAARLRASLAEEG
jgi:hypothetical protein